MHPGAPELRVRSGPFQLVFGTYVFTAPGRGKRPSPSTLVLVLEAVKLVVTVPWGQRLGGAEQILEMFLRHADLERIDVLVVFHAPGPFAAEVERLGARTALLPLTRLRRFRQTSSAIAGLAALLRRERPDLVLDWSTKTHVIGGLAALASGLGHRTAWCQHGLASNALIDRVASLLPAQAVFCWSETAARAQERVWPHRPTIVVHPGAERPTPGALGDMRSALGIPADRFVVGIVGRLQPWKRQDLVLRAVHRLAQAGRDAHALVVGGDAHGLAPEYGPSLRELADRLSIADRVIFTGHVDEADAYIRVMDVLVNASTCEPFGLVLVEAMALGVPVVAFAAGGPLEIIESEISGLLLEGEPLTALVAALERLEDDASLRTRLAEGGHARFEERFTAERMSARLQAELERLAAHANG